MFFSPSQKNKTFTLLDIGTSKITCCIVHCKEGTEAQVIGFSCVAAQGICNGAIVQLDKATECISFALKEAEKNAHNYFTINESGRIIFSVFSALTLMVQIFLLLRNVHVYLTCIFSHEVCPEVYLW